MAWLILDTDREPIRILEIIILTLVWMFPALWIIQLLPVQGIPYGFLLLLAFYGIVMRRILRFIQLETSKN